jgi:hypothetical protein
MLATSTRVPRKRSSGTQVQSSRMVPTLGCCWLTGSNSFLQRLNRPLLPVAPAVIQDTDMMIWKKQVQLVQLVLNCMSTLDSNLQSAYALIRGQCSKPILEKVEAQLGYMTIHQERNPIGLLGLIKAVMFNDNSWKYRGVSIIDIIKPNIVSQTQYI